MYIETRYSRGIKSTLAQVKALPSPVVGETVFCRENGRVLTFDGDLWMCDDFIKSTNSSGTTCIQSDVMIFWVGTGAVSSSKVIRAYDTGNTLVAGVCVYQSLANEYIAIAVKGIYTVKLVYFSTPTQTGGFIRTTSGGGGAAAEMTTVMSAGVFGWTLQPPAFPPVSGTPYITRCLLRGKVEYYF